MPCELHRAAFGREVAVEDGDSAACLQGRLDRYDDGLALGLDRCVRDLAEGAAVDRAGARVEQAGLLQLPRHERDAAGVVHVVCVPASPGLHVGDDRRLRRDALEVVDREVDAEVAGDRDEVQDAVRRPAGRRDRRDGVLERLLRHERARRDVVPHGLNGEPADLVGGLLLCHVHRGDAVRAERREAEEVEDRRHRVRRELTAARARSRARRRLELVQVCVRDLPRRVRADPLVDVPDRDLTLSVEAWRDRAGVEGDRRDVEAPDRHRGAGIRLVAGAQLHEAVEEVATADELDRVRDHLARDERGAHARGSHRDAVRDGHRVELHRRAASVADPALDVQREVALIEVARHRLDPRRPDADDRLREILVGEAGGLEHRASSSAVGAVGQCCAMALGGIGREIVRRAHGVPFSMG